MKKPGASGCVKTTALAHAALKTGWNASPVKMLIYNA